MTNNYYDYTKIIEALKKEESAENINRLGEWFEYNGDRCWNGECWTIEELNADLYPIYEEKDEQFTIVGYELKH